MEEEIKAAAVMAVERLARCKTTKVVTAHLARWIPNLKVGENENLIDPDN